MSSGTKRELGKGPRREERRVPQGCWAGSLRFPLHGYARLDDFVHADVTHNELGEQLDKVGGCDHIVLGPADVNEDVLDVFRLCGEYGTEEKA